MSGGAIRIGSHIIPATELDRRLKDSGPCSQCGGPRFFTSRLIADGLCSICRDEKEKADGVQNHDR